ncbi:hypothetical protein [Vulgatibacter sp.]|uniref:hypothetical protein n=1 Tax=Vulgatibacter sp. TaxID=1971226 RepID=UPI00356656F1
MSLQLLFAVFAATIPAVLFATAPVLLLARLRSWSWGRAAAWAAGLSALLAVVSFAIVSTLVAGGLRPIHGAAAVLVAAAEALCLVGLVALGSRLVDAAQR